MRAKLQRNLEKEELIQKRQLLKEMKKHRKQCKTVKKNNAEVADEFDYVFVPLKESWRPLSPTTAPFKKLEIEDYGLYETCRSLTHQNHGIQRCCKSVIKRMVKDTASRQHR